MKANISSTVSNKSYVGRESKTCSQETIFKSLEHKIKVPGLYEAIAEPFVRGIESTNYCGCHCKACTYDQMRRKKGKMSEELFKLAVENVLKYTSERIITLHHFGDPLLHPKLPEFINYAGSQGLKTKISTVGVALTPKLIDELVESDLTVIKFSFWGTNEREFEYFQNASYRRTMENIHRFIEKKSKIKVIIELLTDGSHKMSELEYYNQWKDMIQMKPAGNWIGDDNQVIKFTKVKRKTTTVPCGKFWGSELKVLWNGDVVPCCMDYDGKAVVGNIQEETIMSIWGGAKMNELRKLHAEGRRGEVELCKFCSCPSWQRPSRADLLC